MNETVIKSIVTNPDTDYFFVENFRGLRDNVDKLVRRVCGTTSTTGGTTPTTLETQTTAVTTLHKSSTMLTSDDISNLSGNF